ncbi:hypothetical protein K456DRAFT_1824540 [Colletotrichum gloeosporioides 23]|nr:hypothetical protein K456DRAFT_1824540 [Colletotrichum gloeosporioides 23]
MQFMSQSLGWADCIALAMAPLGIITIIVSAIRVGGPMRLKAIIGRAKENTSVAEMELMSSTSREVCELYNGESIVRCQGLAPVWEYMCLVPRYDTKKDSVRRNDQTETGLTADDPIDGSSMIVIRNTGPEAPNISLNLSESHSRTPIRTVAVMGIILQLGVLAVFAVMTYPSYTRNDFKKDDEAVPEHAFSLAASGTILLVAGLLLCARVVESSTHEQRYKPTEGYEIHLYWLQQGQTVSDQVFESFATFPSLPRTEIITSRRSKDYGEGRDNKRLQLMAIIGVLIGLVGFVIQFVGLRAMNAAASLAQLAAVGAMTIARALVRPGFASSFEKSRLLAGVEIDWLA